MWSDYNTKQLSGLDSSTLVDKRASGLVSGLVNGGYRDCGGSNADQDSIYTGSMHGRSQTPLSIYCPRGLATCMAESVMNSSGPYSSQSDKRGERGKAKNAISRRLIAAKCSGWRRREIGCSLRKKYEPRCKSWKLLSRSGLTPPRLAKYIDSSMSSVCAPLVIFRPALIQVLFRGNKPARCLF